MTDDPYSPTGLALRCGRLSVALEMLLEVIDELPVALDVYTEIRVDTARRTFDEAGASRVTE